MQSDREKLTLRKQEKNLLVTRMCVDSFLIKCLVIIMVLKMNSFAFKLNVINLNCLQQAQSL